MDNGRKILLNLIENAILKKDHRQSDATITDYPTISEVSIYFNLNERQEQAFRMFSIPVLLQCFEIEQHELPNCYKIEEPFLVFGGGGVGKSRIVRAIKFFFEKWNLPHSVIIQAPTGVAAFEIGGTTQHSGLMLPLTWPADRLPEPLNSPSEELINVWKPVYGYILDEISFENPKVFETTMLALNKLKALHVNDQMKVKVMLLGNFCQLPPVTGKFIFCNPKKPITTLMQRGHLRYTAIKNAVHLTQERRYDDDLEWGVWLKPARQGNWLPEMKQFLSTRVISIEQAIEKFKENLLVICPE